jgi:hypothetical protein
MSLAQRAWLNIGCPRAVALGGHPTLPRRFNRVEGGSPWGLDRAIE